MPMFPLIYITLTPIVFVEKWPQVRLIPAKKSIQFPLKCNMENLAVVAVGQLQSAYVRNYVTLTKISLLYLP